MNHSLTKIDNIFIFDEDEENNINKSFDKETNNTFVKCIKELKDNNYDTNINKKIDNQNFFKIKNNKYNEVGYKNDSINCDVFTYVYGFIIIKNAKYDLYFILKEKHNNTYKYVLCKVKTINEFKSFRTKLILSYQEFLIVNNENINFYNDNNNDNKSTIIESLKNIFKTKPKEEQYLVISYNNLLTKYKKDKKNNIIGEKPNDPNDNNSDYSGGKKNFTIKNKNLKKIRKYTKTYKNKYKTKTPIKPKPKQKLP